MDAAARNAELERERAKERELRIALQARVEQLEALVVELQEQLGRNSSNSNQPPSSDSPSQREKNRAKRRRRADKKRKRGGQPNHKGSSRRLVAEDKVDAFEHHYPCACGSCWKRLPEDSTGVFSRFQVTELTSKGGVTVTEHRCHSVRCECGFVTKASRDVLPPSAFGPRLCATIVMLTGVFHLSRQQAKLLLSEVLGVSIATGSISNIEHRSSERLKAGYEQAKQAADDAAIKHADGTSWRQAGTPLSLWTIATTTVTVFSVLANGSAKQLRSLFGRIKGILVSDRAKAINFWKMVRRQICWAHLHRKFISFSERDGPARGIGEKLVEPVHF